MAPEEVGGPSSQFFGEADGRIDEPFFEVDRLLLDEEPEEGSEVLT
jgi:hypothetical protein